MADNELTIADNGTAIDSILVQNTFTLQEYKKNILQPNCATGGDVKGDTTGFSRNNSSLTSLTYVTDEKHSGNGCIKCTNTSGSLIATNIYLDGGMDTGIFTNRVDAGKTYVLSGWAKTDAGATNGLFRCYTYDSIGNVISILNGTAYADITNWTYMTGVFTMPAGTVSARFYFGKTSHSAGQSIWLDELQLEIGGSATPWEYPSIGQAKESPTIRNNVVVLDSMDYLRRNIVDANVADCTNSLGTTSGWEVHADVTIESDPNNFYRENRSLKVTTGSTSSLHSTKFKIRGGLVGETLFGAIVVKAPNGTNMQFYLATASGAYAYSWVANGEWQTVGYSRPYATKYCYIGTLIKNISFNVGQVQVSRGSLNLPWMPGNLLTNIQQSVDGSTTGLAGGYGTYSLDTTDFYSGNGSLKLVSDASGGAYIALTGVYPPMVEGNVYLFMVTGKGSNTSKYGYLQIKWYDANNVLFETTNSTNILWNGKWQTRMLILKAPPGTASARVFFREASPNTSGDIIWWDEGWLLKFTEQDVISIANNLKVPENGSIDESIAILNQLFMGESLMGVDSIGIDNYLPTTNELSLGMDEVYLKNMFTMIDNATSMDELVEIMVSIMMDESIGSQDHVDIVNHILMEESLTGMDEIIALTNTFILSENVRGEDLISLMAMFSILETATGIDHVGHTIPHILGTLRFMLEKRLKAEMVVQRLKTMEMTTGILKRMRFQR